MTIEIDIGKIFREVIKDAGKDPEVRRQADENQLRYGTLTADDLKMQFTI